MPPASPLLLLTVGETIEQRDTVGLGPQAHPAGILEGRILDLKKRLAVVDDVEACPCK